jgi:hypothetical protein
MGQLPQPGSHHAAVFSLKRAIPLLHRNGHYYKISPCRWADVAGIGRKICHSSGHIWKRNRLPNMGIKGSLCSQGQIEFDRLTA